MIQKKLKEVRQAKNITQNQMANIIAMEQTTYSRKERGKSPILNEEWERISKALDVPIDNIKIDDLPITIKNENCTFNDNIGVQHINIPQNVFDIIIKYNSKLEEENQLQKEEIKRLSQKT